MDIKALKTYIKDNQYYIELLIDVSDKDILQGSSETFIFDNKEEMNEKLNELIQEIKQGIN